MRTYDRIGRYGGEEFLVVLPNCDLEQAAHQAERLRSRLDQQPVFVDGTQLNVTASFGVTVSDGRERSPEELIRIADEALYRAKANGRNCVEGLIIEERPRVAGEAVGAPVARGAVRESQAGRGSSASSAVD
jgi:diguanylate cyclase (GGDEF)-like protein